MYSCIRKEELSTIHIYERNCIASKKHQAKVTEVWREISMKVFTLDQADTRRQAARRLCRRRERAGAARRGGQPACGAWRGALPPHAQKTTTNMGLSFEELM